MNKGKLFVLVLLSALMMFSTKGTAYALTNGSFESNDTTGWGINDPSKAAVVSSHEGDTSSYSPKDGIYFLELWAGIASNQYTKASQTFTVSNGQWVTGWAAFDARDLYPYNDSAYVKVINADNDIVWYATVASAGDYADGPWTLWESDPLAAGSYTLEFGVRNVKNNLNPSIALFDGATVAPEPISMLLVGVGMFGLPFALRFRGFTKRSI